MLKTSLVKYIFVEFSEMLMVFSQSCLKFKLRVSIGLQFMDNSIAFCKEFTTC